MATLNAVFVPDYPGSQADDLVDVITTTSNTGPLIIKKYSIFKVVFSIQPGSAVPAILRFTLGNSVTGAVAPTPDSTAPFLLSNQENIFETNAGIDSINFANLVADNGAVTIAYAIIPLLKF